MRKNWQRVAHSNLNPSRLLSKTVENTERERIANERRVASCMYVHNYVISYPARRRVVRINSDIGGVTARCIPFECVSRGLDVLRHIEIR